MRVPSGEPELVRAGAAGDPAALAALWDAYGARVFAFCQRVLGRADAAADAARDAFLLAHSQLGRLASTGESFGGAVFQAARTTCHDLLARDGAAGAARHGLAPSLSAATARLRPQQRAALAVSGLERLRYAEIAAVLGIGTEAVGALLARARLRLHDELHGTALAAAAVRSADCEDVLALLAAASDGELGPADAAWADPHVASCPTCPRTRRAMDEAAATYAAWSPTIAPSWLREATLADLGAEAPAAAALAATAGALALGGAGWGAAGPGAASRRAGGAWSTPPPRLSAALLGASLLAVACAALALTQSGSLRQRDPLSGGPRLPDAARSLRVAGVPAKHQARARRRASRRTRPTRVRQVAFVAVRAVRRVPSASLPSATRGVTGTAPRRPAARPKRRPGRRTPATPVPASSAPPTPAAPAPVTADAPADELPGASPTAAGGAPATTAQAPAAVSPLKTTAAPQAPSIPAAQPASSDPDRWRGPGGDRDHGDGPSGDQDYGGGWHQDRPPCPPPPRCQGWSCRH